MNRIKISKCVNGKLLPDEIIEGIELKGYLDNGALVISKNGVFFKVFAHGIWLIAEDVSLPEVSLEEMPSIFN